MELRILPGNIANMIAAGEVVQRPASVVKELVENAVDAGADQISVIIKDSGRTLIQVIDNGKGMNPDDAVLCFERHATSKIATAEDLEDITTFG
ncbi:MAG TPA: DNA mismatch repair protein MutL, partial [Rikenellaceae bacterium]|nr:DNA mismatch repair protein MutL [Rikenellaceae bacterium]